MYKTHRWFAVVAGGFFIVWILSGILTMFQLPLEDSGQGKDLPLDFRMATISPSEAIQIVEKISGKTVEVREVHLDEILGKVIYRVYINHGPSHLIDAQTGKEIIIDKQMGEEIAKSRLPNHMEIFHTEYLETHTSEYSNGPLPVYKISFNDTWNTLSIVEKSSGKERHNNLCAPGESVTTCYSNALCCFRNVPVPNLLLLGQCGRCRRRKGGSLQTKDALSRL